MIHIEDNWYIKVGGYKDYTLGTYKKAKIIDKEVEVLENATYYNSFERALSGYVEIRISNLLKKQDLEVVDALNMVQAEYKRLAELFRQIFSEPQIVRIVLSEVETAEKSHKNASDDECDKMSE